MEKCNISASFLEKYKITLTDQELLWGMDKDFIRPKAVIDYAVAQLANLHEKDSLYDIALLSSKEERYKVREILEEKLINKDSSYQHAYSEDELTEKWLYLLLKWLYSTRESFDDPWSMIEMIYADLNYPEAIKGLIRYMPAQDCIQNNFSPVENMTHRWELFLKEKDKKFIGTG